jgi:hypothetical protein
LAGRRTVGLDVAAGGVEALARFGEAFAFARTLGAADRADFFVAGRDVLAGLEAVACRAGFRGALTAFLAGLAALALGFVAFGRLALPGLAVARRGERFTVAFRDRALEAERLVNFFAAMTLPLLQG